MSVVVVVLRGGVDEPRHSLRCKQAMQCGRPWVPEARGDGWKVEHEEEFSTAHAGMEVPEPGGVCEQR